MIVLGHSLSGEVFRGLVCHRGSGFLLQVAVAPHGGSKGCDIGDGVELLHVEDREPVNMTTLERGLYSALPPPICTSIITLAVVNSPWNHPITASLAVAPIGEPAGSHCDGVGRGEESEGRGEEEPTATAMGQGGERRGVACGREGASGSGERESCAWGDE